MLQVTRALVERGRLDLPAGILAPVDVVLASTSDTAIPYTVRGRGGRIYAKYGLGQSLAASPLYLLGMVVRRVTGADHAQRTAALLLNALVTASTAGLLVVLARALAFSRRTALVLGGVLALCTPAWVYTKTFFSEPLVTFCLVLAAVGLARFSRRRQGRWLALSGLALGCAVLTRVDAVLALPAFALYLAASWRRQPASLRKYGVQLSAGLGAFLLGIGLTLAYNYLRLGHPLDFGYHTSNWQTPFFDGLYGLTLSPGKGLVWYAPPILLGLLGLPAFVRTRPYEALLCLGIVAGYLLGHACYTYWEGGWCWGPRLLLPALPFALVPACALFQTSRARAGGEIGLAAILVLGLVVQIPAVGSSYLRPLQILYAEAPDSFQVRMLYRVEDSPLLRQWSSLVEVVANVRDAAARRRVVELIASASPGDTLLLADTHEEAVRLKQQSILAFNVPDFWFVMEQFMAEALSISKNDAFLSSARAACPGASPGHFSP